MAAIYTTQQGDTFDSIAFWLYGDEKYMKELIEMNWDKAHVLVFDAGVKLYAPDITEEEDEDLPFWREASDNDDDEPTDEDYYEYDEEPDEEEGDEDLTDEESEDSDPDIDDEEEGDPEDE